MQRFYMNLTTELSEEIERKARISKRTKAEVAWEALQIGLEKITSPKSSFAKALLDLAKAAKKFKGSAPRDLSKNHDKYTWD